jgi:hypothetical protein
MSEYGCDGKAVGRNNAFAGAGSGALTVATRDVALKDDLVRAGLNWRFTSLP